VNQRHNRLHVRLLEVRDATPAAFMPDGFARKLNLKPATPAAHLNTLRHLLHGLDRHCVPDVETLERTPHAMTVQGLMSSQSGHFDKQDQKRLDQDWMTGFDNRDRLAHLLQQKEQLALDYQALEAKKTQTLNAQRQAQEKRQLWAALQALRREDLDTAAADAQLQHKTQQLQALLHPGSDTAQAQKRWDAAQEQTRAAEAQWRDLQTAQTQDETLRTTAQKKHSAYHARSAGAAVIDTDFATDFAARLASAGHRLPPLDGDNLETQEREAGTTVQAKVTEASKKLGTLHTDIVRQMGKAKAEDRGALADHAQEVDALPHYLQRLQALEEEALPHKRQRFQEYLNNTSQQGVDTLLNGIAAQVTDIEERIAQLNDTLQRVDFQPGRYLQLEPAPWCTKACKNSTAPRPNCAPKACATTAAKATTAHCAPSWRCCKPTPATAAARPRKRCWMPATACSSPCWCSTGPAAGCWSGAPDRKAAAGARKKSSPATCSPPR
jgi:Uncharacterized protein conserved in bacteria